MIKLNGFLSLDDNISSINEKVYNEIFLDIEELLRKDGRITQFGNFNVEFKSKTSIYLRFDNVRANRATEQRSIILTEIFNVIEEYIDKNVKKDTTGSSIGTVKFTYKNQKFTIAIKGGNKNSSNNSIITDTDIKEGLVILFYNSDIKTIEKNNLYEVCEKLIKVADSINFGLSKDTINKLKNYLELIKDKITSETISFLNNPLSSALTIKKDYPNCLLTRFEIFNEIRSDAGKLSGLPPDKWNPGDIYVIIDKNKINYIPDNIENINNLFNDDWGSTERSITAVSLKLEQAFGGKAKCYLQKIAADSKKYNLTNDEIKYTEEEFIKNIDILRAQIKDASKRNENIVYIDKYDVNKVKNNRKIRNLHKWLLSKYASLKILNFIYEVANKLGSKREDNMIVAIAAYGLSLSELNPTFFKSIGNPEGVYQKPYKYQRGDGIVLFNDGKNYEPIKIVDDSEYGGIKMQLKVEMRGEHYTLFLNAKGNGNTQATVELDKPQKI